MQARLVGAALSVALLCGVGVARAAVIGEQRTVAATSTASYGGVTYALPSMEGTLKAFDLYVSLSVCDLTFHHCNLTGNDDALYVELDGLSSEIFSATSTYTTIPHGTGAYPDPVLVHFVWDPAASTPAGYPVLAAGAHTLALGTSNGAGITTGVVSTFTDGGGNVYFVGYDAVGTPPTVSDVSIMSGNASSTLARAGDAVTLTFSADTTDGPMRTPTVSIGSHAGVSVATTSVSGTKVTYQASTTLDTSDTDGTLGFSIQVANTYGDQNAATTGTTDGSAVAFDNTAPNLTFDSGPANAATASSSPVVFAFTADDPQASLVCAWDGAATSTCSSPAQQTLADGAHTFAVVATDPAGNVATSTRTFTVDATAPTLSIDSGPAGGSTVSTSSVEFAFTAGADAAVVECSYDGAATSTCTSPFATTSPDGAHTFAVAASDSAGNVSYLSRAFTIDTAPPAPPPSHGGGGGGGGSNGPPIQNPSQGLPQGVILGEQTQATLHASPAAVEQITRVAPPAATAAPASHQPKAAAPQQTKTPAPSPAATPAPASTPGSSNPVIPTAHAAGQAAAAAEAGDSPYLFFELVFGCALVAGAGFWLSKRGK